MRSAERFRDASKPGEIGESGVGAACDNRLDHRKGATDHGVVIQNLITDEMVPRLSQRAFHSMKRETHILLHNSYSLRGFVHRSRPQRDNEGRSTRSRDDQRTQNGTDEIRRRPPCASIDRRQPDLHGGDEFETNGETHDHDSGVTHPDGRPRGWDPRSGAMAESREVTSQGYKDLHRSRDGR